MITINSFHFLLHPHRVLFCLFIAMLSEVGTIENKMVGGFLCADDFVSHYPQLEKF